MTRNGKSQVHKPKPLILCAEFKTTPDGIPYAVKNNDSFIYGVHVIRVPLADVVLKKDKVTSKTPGTPLKFCGGGKKPNLLNKSFGTGEDFINHVLTKMELVKDSLIYLYIHKGQNKEFTFIYKGLIKNHGYRAITPQDEAEIKKTNQNYYTGEKSDEGNSGALHFYVERLNGYVTIDLRDTEKLQPGTIGEIKEDITKMYPDGVNNEGFKTFTLNNSDLNNTIQDLDGDTVIGKDYKFNLHTPKQGPKEFKQGIKGNVEVLVLMLYYYILNQVINPVDYHADLCLTQGQVALKCFYKDIGESTQHGTHKNKRDLYADYYGSSFTDRINDYLRLSGSGSDGLRHPSIMRGGYCNGLDSIKNQELNGDFLSYDVNSLYPYEATKPVPVGTPGQTYDGDTILRNKDYWGVVGVRAKSLKQLITNIPALIPTKFSEAEQKNNGHYAYEVNDFYGCFTKQEGLVFSNPKGFKGEEPTIDFYEGYFTSPIIKHYMETNYQDKIEASKQGNKIKRISAKLKLNSLTGQFGRKLYKFSKMDPNSCTYEHFKKELTNIEGMDTDNLADLQDSAYTYNGAKKNNQNIQVPLLNLSVKFANPSIYCFITGGGRAYLQRLMLTLGEHFKDNIKVLYSDTDSLKIGTTDKQQVQDYLKSLDLVDEFRLGAFKEEFNGAIKYFKYVCPKKYFVEDDKHNLIPNKSAFAGVNGEDVYKENPTPHLEDFYVGAKFNTYKPEQTDNGMIMRKVIYEIKE